MCLSQGQNAVPPVRLEPATLRSRAKYSTTEPLRSLIYLPTGVFNQSCLSSAHFLNARTLPILSSSFSFSSFSDFFLQATSRGNLYASSVKNKKMSMTRECQKHARRGCTQAGTCRQNNVTLNKNGQIYTDEKDKANILNNFFTEQTLLDENQATVPETVKNTTHKLDSIIVNT